MYSKGTGRNWERAGGFSLGTRRNSESEAYTTPPYIEPREIRCGYILSTEKGGSSGENQGTGKKREEWSR